MTFLLAHFSDAHIGPIPRPNLAELIGKRVTGYVNWLNKRAGQHDMRVLALLLDDLRAQRPDHVAMTGDVVNIGLPAELASARDWLLSLGPYDRVSFTPGNHDIYVRGVEQLARDLFAPWTQGDDRAIGFPYVRRRAGVTLIGLSSAIPTAPFVASGRLGESQLRRLRAVLEDTRAPGNARVVMLHHPPHIGGAKRLRGLDDAADFEAVIAESGAELILHGHNHRPSLAILPSRDGPVPVVGVASASAKRGAHQPPASYHLFSIACVEGGRPTISGRIRGLNESGEQVVDLGPAPLPTGA